VESISFLKQVPLFNNLSTIELIRISRLIKRICVKRNEIIIREGEPSSDLYLIKKGKVKVTKNTKRGEKIVAFLEEGEPFGELALIDKAPRSANVIASIDCTLLKIESSELINLLDNYPDIKLKIYEKLVHLLVSRLRTTNENLVTLKKDIE